jgi:hypothetical protein
MYSHQPGPQASQPASKRTPATKSVAAARPTGPRPGRVAGLLALQRLAGNAAVTRLIAAQRRDAVQAALSVQGRRLMPQVRADMEARLGADLSDVHVHTGPAADRAAQAVAAEAFTSGSHLVFRRGRYNPSSAAGKRVLAHELVHVLQQRRGPVAGTGDSVRISDPADRFEREAEATAQLAVSECASRRRAIEPGGSPVSRQGNGVQGTLAVQRLRVKYGGTNGDDVGTSMQAEIDPNNVQMGSKPSVRPNWWPGCTTVPGTTWVSKYMVQGHLLNEKIGGPGNTMDNLTPITKSCNSQHHAKVEKAVKNLAKNRLLRYHVTADYGKHPDGEDLTGISGATPLNNDLDANFAPKLAYKLHAEYTAYDYNTLKQAEYDSWQIANKANA